MEIQQKTGQAMTAKKPLKVSTIISGLVMLIIPIAVGVLVTRPDITQMLLNQKDDILKGFVIGCSMLPVFVFVGIKGGEQWFKKVWAWILILVACSILGTIMLLAEPSANHSNMDMFYGNMYRDY